jgi:hypothetical protein
MLCKSSALSKAVPKANWEPGQPKALRPRAKQHLTQSVIAHPAQPLPACLHPPAAAKHSTQAACTALCLKKCDLWRTTTHELQKAVLPSTPSFPVPRQLERRCAPLSSMAQQLKSSKAGSGDQGLSLKRKLEAAGADLPGLKFPARDAGPEVGAEADLGPKPVCCPFLHRSCTKHSLPSVLADVHNTGAVSHRGAEECRNPVWPRQSTAPEVSSPACRALQTR